LVMSCFLAVHCQFHVGLLIASTGWLPLLAESVCTGPRAFNSLDTEDVLRAVFFRYVLAPCRALLSPWPLWAVWCEVTVWSACLSLIKRACRINLPLSPSAGLDRCSDPGHKDQHKPAGRALEALSVRAARCQVCSWANLTALARSCLVAVVLCELCLLLIPSTALNFRTSCPRTFWTARVFSARR
jgi:hypothetical protein